MQVYQWDADAGGHEVVLVVREVTPTPLLHASDASPPSPAPSRRAYLRWSISFFTR